MVAGHLQEKNGMFYVVLNYRDENGKRKTPWISTNLPVKGNKKRAENFMMDVRRNFVPPNVQRIEEREAMQKGDILFTDFLLKWLRVAKSTVKLTTYASYEMMATRIIIPYFRDFEYQTQGTDNGRYPGILQCSARAGICQHSDSLSRGHSSCAEVCGQNQNNSI